MQGSRIFADETARPWSLLTPSGIALGIPRGISFLATWANLGAEASEAIRSADLTHVEALETADALTILANTLRNEVAAAHAPTRED